MSATYDPSINPHNRTVRVERHPGSSSIAVIVIDNPPVNAGSHEVRAGLNAAIDVISADPQITGAVLVGAGSTFVSGSDIKEFSLPLMDPQMPAVIAALEACPKPIVAAIHGAALGGGYELALGCDARVAAPDAILGLPEVTLGMIPGAGGTVRLPRIANPAVALDLILSGRRIAAKEAVEVGLVDQVADGDLQAAAAGLAAKLAATTGKRRIRDLCIGEYDAGVYQKVVEAAARGGKARPQVIEAIAAVDRALVLPFDDALEAERLVFQTLRQGEEAAALRYLFFAERTAGRVEVGNASSMPAKVAVIGAGLMGSGIASSFLGAGFEVHMMDPSEEAVERGYKSIAAVEDRAVVTGRITASERERSRRRLSTAGDWSHIGHADLVIEAAFEDLEVKKDIFRRLSAEAAPHSILATNTSYLDVDALAAETNRPQDVVGLHFFSPANIMRLVEIVRGAKTAPDVVATAVRIVRKLGKIPVISAVSEGFIANRIFMAYRQQCEYLLEDGALPEEVDAALTAFGFAMGPFATWDMAGLDIAWQTRRRLAATRDPQERYVPLLDQLCEAGRLGRKSGAGWYRYEAGSPRGQPDSVVRELIEIHRSENQTTVRTIGQEEIVDRALGAIVNEAALVIDEGVAERASDIDLVLVHGYGFPKHRGGPLFWAGRQSGAKVAAILDMVAIACGSSFRRGPVERTIRPAGA
ncbi:MAG: enoyl-CoA hydratase/isomerase family protein [Beijerinckiaceae bacterium]|nr:enoyl-CoA hydratase/isomerase family protein [Beijerinckiaceae bacterium]